MKPDSSIDPGFAKESDRKAMWTMIWSIGFILILLVSILGAVFYAVHDYDHRTSVKTKPPIQDPVLGPKNDPIEAAK